MLKIKWRVTLKKSIKFLVVSLVFSFLLVSSSQLFANSNLRVIVSGKEVKFDQSMGKPFIDEKNRAQVPFRKVMEACGAQVSWDAKTSTASAKKGNMKIDVPIWKPIIYKNGYPMLNDTSARIVNNRTYLPIRSVLESLGYDVLWRSNDNTVVAFAKDTSLYMKKVNLPSYYDMRKSGRVDPVRNQYDSPHCWAFASSSALATSLLPKEKYIFSPVHVADYSKSKTVYPAGGGTPEIAAAYYMSWGGPVLENDYPFESAITNNNPPVQKHVQGYKTFEQKDYDAIKKAIYEKGGVVTAIYSYNEDKEKNNNIYNPRTYAQNYAGTSNYNHVVVLVGWDDNYSKNNFLIKPKTDGAFIAKNSYGTDWGDNGYYYISYHDLHVGTFAVAYTDIEPSNNYSTIYSPDKMGCTSWTSFQKNNAHYANIFSTAGNTEKIKAVALFSLNTSMNYEIRLVKNYNYKPDTLWKNGEIIASGKLVGEGYHTIKIPNPPTVKGDFGIVVYGSTKDELFKVPYEQPFLDAEAAFDIKDGLGYIYDGYYWYNTEKLDNSNICLKVYTDPENKK